MVWNQTFPATAVCITERCVCMQPFGSPVVPDVYGMQQRSSGPAVCAPGARWAASASSHGVTFGAATAWKGLHHGPAMIAHYGAASIALGFGCAAVTAWISVRWMVAWLQRRGLALFGWYRVGLALAVAFWLVSKR